MTITIENKGYWWNPFRKGSGNLPAPAEKVQSTWKQSALQITTSVAGGVGRTLKAGANGAVYLLNVAKDKIVSTVPNQAEMMLHLYFLLEELESSTSGPKPQKPFTRVNRNELAERLEDFIKECNPTEKAFLESFCKDLKDLTFDLNADRVSKLRNILSPYLQKHNSYIQATAVERHRLEMLPDISNLPPAQALSKKETFEGIQNQMNLLKSNSIKMVLGMVMLNMTLGISTIKDINPENRELDFVQILGIDPTNANGNLVNLLIEASNKVKMEGKSSDEVFLELINRIIDHSDKNIFRRYQAKLRCKYLSKLISSYLTNVFDNLKKPLLHFATLSPEEQMKEITALLITPLSDHLSDVEKSYQDIDTDRNLLGGHHLKHAGSIPKMINFLLNNKNSDTKNSEQVLDHFIDIFLNELVDPIHQHWTRTFREFCFDKASHSTFFPKIAFRAMGGLSWVVGKVIAPLQWSLNEAIRLILKKTIASLFPSLMGSTKGALGIGNAYSWHSLKNNLLITLQQTRLDRMRPRVADPSYAPSPKNNPEIQEKFNTVLDQLLKVLVTQDKNLDGGIGFVNQLQDLLHSTLKTAVSDLAVNMCSKEGFFNGVILSSLQSTNINTFAHKAVVVSEEEKQRVEQELEKELSLLAKNIVVDLRDGLRSDKQAQKEANTYLHTLKEQVHAFQQKFVKESRRSTSLASLELLYTNFSQSLEAMRSTIQESAVIDGPTKAALISYIEQCLSKAKEITETLNGPTPIEEIRSQVDRKLNQLSSCLKNPLAAEEEIDLILEELRGLNPSFLDINALEDDLLKLMKPYTSKLLRAKVNEKHPQVLSKPLITLIADYRIKANTEAHRHDRELKMRRSAAVALSLVQWANGLSSIKVTAKPGLKDAGLALALGNPITSAAASSLVLSYGKNFFHFISQECHIDGIVTRVMVAYNKKPPLKGLESKPLRTFVGVKFPYSQLDLNNLKSFLSDWAKKARRLSPVELAASTC